MLPEMTEYSLINIDRFRRNTMGNATFNVEMTLVPTLAIDLTIVKKRLLNDTGPVRLGLQ